MPALAVQPLERICIANSLASTSDLKVRVDRALLRASNRLRRSSAGARRAVARLFGAGDEIDRFAIRARGDEVGISMRGLDAQRWLWRTRT